MERRELATYESMLLEELKDKNGVIQYRNIYSADCFICGEALEKGEGYRIPTKNRGIVAICPCHYGIRGLLRYHGNAEMREYTDNKIGSDKKMSLTKTTIGIEVETNKSGLSDLAYTSARLLIEKSFMVRGESDGSISCGAEFPSEKMEGLATVSKVLQTLEYNGMLDILTNDDDLGAHCHVGIDDMEYLKRYYQSILFPLNDYIANMSIEKRVKYFGSDFRYYAKNVRDKVRENTSSNEISYIHDIMFNCQHSHTLEFRLPRITGYEQYLKVLKFWREIGYTINTFDLCKNGDFNIRKQRAIALGLKLVKIARKYFD